MFPWAHYTISLLVMPTEILRGKSHGQKKKSVVSLIQAFRYHFGHMYYNNTLRARPSPYYMRAMRHAVKEHSCSHSLQCKRGKQKHREMTWEPEKRGTRQTQPSPPELLASHFQLRLALLPTRGNKFVIVWLTSAYHHSRQAMPVLQTYHVHSQPVFLQEEQGEVRWNTNAHLSFDGIE